MSQDEPRDFGDILAAFEQEQPAGGTGEDPEPGSKASGAILSIGDESTFVDLGGKSDGVVATAELLDDDGDLTVDVGDMVSGVIAGRDEASGGLILRVKPGASGAGLAVGLEELSQAYEHRIPVEGMVSEVVKGGVEVTVSGVRAFCPVSQLDDAYVEDPAVFVGRRLTFRVKKFARSGRGGRPNVVLSRRELLAEEKRRRREEALARLAVGTVVRGTVSSVTTYGAFVDLGGVEGLLHVSEMAHDRVEKASDLVAEGEEIEVKVLSVEEREGSSGPEQRISLSRRALERDPWEEAGTRFPEGTAAAGRVVRLEAYGAFVRLAPGLDGLVHVSELAPGRPIAHAREALELGQDVRVRILGVDSEKRRISLALAAQAEDADTPSAKEYSKSAAGSSGFGTMADFFDKAKKG